jgi:hypothetical protein
MGSAPLPRLDSRRTECRKWLFSSSFEFSDTSASSEGWRVQWESVPPGEESEPRSLDRIGGGNEADEADRQSPLEEGEQVTGPQRE